MVQCMRTVYQKIIVAPFTFIVSGKFNIGQIFLFYNVF